MYLQQRKGTYDTLIIPFRQYLISVAGAVMDPGRYPYIPDRTWEYYIGLAGGFVNEKNMREVVKIRDINGKNRSDYAGNDDNGICKFIYILFRIVCARYNDRSFRRFDDSDDYY